jgi:translation initiation factor IF-3
LLVIGPDGEKLGLLDRDVAMKMAHDQDLELVEIAPNAKPPVAKILDFKKFKYEESKREQAAKKHAKDVELKEIWLTPRIAEHDLQTRLRRVDEFLKDGHKIMFRVKFKGREMAHLEFGFELLKKIFAHLGDRMSIERDPKVEGRSITAIVGKFRPGAAQNKGAVQGSPPTNSTT